MKKPFLVSCIIEGERKKVIVMANRKSHAKRVSERSGLPSGVQKTAQLLNKDFKSYG